MRKYKKAIAPLLAVSIVMSMTACGTQQEAAVTTVTESTASGSADTKLTAEANTVYTGTVTAIDADSITLNTEDGEVTIRLADSTSFSMDFGDFGGNGSGQMPDGDMPQKPDNGQGDQSEQDQSSDNNSNVFADKNGAPDKNAPAENADKPADAAGSEASNMTPPAKPDGEQGEQPVQASTPPEQPDNGAQDANTAPPQKPAGEQNGAPDGKPGGQPEQNDNTSERSDKAQNNANGQNTQNQTPPAKPDGEQNGTAYRDQDQNGSSNSISMPDGTAYEQSDDTSDKQEPGFAPGAEAPAIGINDIAAGDTVTVETDADGNAASVTLTLSTSNGMQPGGQPGSGNGGPGGPGGMSQGVESYDAATEFTADATETGGSYTSTGTNENAVHVYNGAAVTIKNASIARDSDDSTGGDSSSFYGVGAAALVTDGGLNISDSTITTDSAGGAGVFAYGDGTAYVSDTSISTKQDTSGGIHVAGGGTLYAWNLDVDTEGESSAAIRSDRGGGSMVVDGGNYTSNGTGSPAIYSTANIAVNNAKLEATGSEAVCIEGLNSIRLFDSELTGNMKDLDQNDCTWNVILYQSMSGDSELGNSTFEMVGGKLTAKNGGMFYTTNTESTFILSDVDISYADNSEFFLKCTGNSNQRGWGTSGANGADCDFTAVKQDMEGDVIWDSISQLDYYILKGSKLTGAIIQDESNAGNGGDGYADVYIDADSSWIVTGDSRLSSLHCAGSITDAKGSTVTIKGSDGTVYVDGNSEYTITVESYDTDVDTKGAASSDSWSDFEVERANA